MKAAGVNPIDWKIIRGKFKLITGRRFPKILGTDIAGIVKETGKNITAFKSGDEVMVMVNIMTGHGGYTELVATEEKYICKKPANRTYIEAAAVPGSAMTALQVLQRKAHLQQNQQILINGASEELELMLSR